MTGEGQSEERVEQPRGLSRPADAAAPLDPAGVGHAVQHFRHELAAQSEMRRRPRAGSTRARARAWAGRVSGRADRRLLFALAEATTALIDHCDAVGERLTSAEALLAELTTTLGVEITWLRAEVDHLRRRSESSEADGGG